MAAPLLADAPSKLDRDLVYHAFFSDDAAVQPLLEQGANPNAINKDGVSALALAATRDDAGGRSVIKALLAGDADMEWADAHGQTALFYAARTGNEDSVMLLLESGADFYAADKDKKLARNLAFERGHTQLGEKMDAFIDQKRQSVLDEYKEYHEKMMAPKPVPKPPKPEVVIVEVPVPMPAPPEPESIDEETFHKAVHDLSMQSCALQYWYFIKGVQLGISMTPAELHAQMTGHRKAVKVPETILETFGADKAYLETITKPSEELIYKQLEAYGSNATRKSHGIGEVGDMQQRCEEIAGSWEIEMP